MIKNAIVVVLLASALLACNSTPKQTSDEAMKNSSNVQANKTVTLAVEGMTCEGCENTVKESVEKLPGIASAKASYKEKAVVIAFDSTQAKVNDISAAITDVGYEVKGLKPTGSEVVKTH
jgi:copper chaperone CopZ